jgi:hypothetical protein
MTFWRREKHPKSGIIIHHCDKHNFHSTELMEIEEHERIHEIEAGGLRI